MNDTFLSDWRGIIGEDLEKQEEIESELEELYDKLEQVESMSTHHDDALKALPEQLSKISSKLSEDVRRLSSASPIPIRWAHKRRIEALIKCESCGTETETKVLLRPGYSKVFRCENCRRFNTVTVQADGTLASKLVETKDETITCSICDNQFSISYPLHDNYLWQIECTRCSSIMQARVKDGGLIVTQAEKIGKAFIGLLERLGKEQTISPEFVSSVAGELGISKSKVRQGYSILYRLGRVSSNAGAEPSVVVQEVETPRTGS